MKGRTPIFFTVKDLFKRYPTIVERGWTEEDFEFWVSRDLITGRHREHEPNVLEIEQESIEIFLAYHNAHLKLRNDRLSEDIERVKKELRGRDKTRKS
ncbi:MAG: hypothetical protein HYZ14_15385 [Bacteroidetes bacterium]|nr:hypothetical protein [Bacteroidota bacterium]